MTSSEPASVIHILIADATAMVCELLKSAFKRRPKFAVKACATTLDEVGQALGDVRIDVSLVGTNLANAPCTGIEAIQLMRTLQPRCRPVLLLEGKEDALIVEAFRAGPKRVFRRSEQGFEALCKCVACVYAGEIWVNSKQLEVVLEALAGTTPLRVVKHRATSVLSKREDEIVALVAEGATNREIATHLGLSQHTVKNYLFKIFDKVGVSSRVELVLYALHRHTYRATSRPERMAS